MIITSVTEKMVEHVAKNMRSKDFEEIIALSWCDNKTDLSQELIGKYTPEWAICAFFEDTPVAIGGLFEMRPNVISLGFFATDYFPCVGKNLSRWIKKDLFAPMIQEGLARLEAHTLHSHTDAHRWLEFLGLKKEAELEKFGKNGETFYSYAWVDDGVVCPSCDA
jgi:hypothetical protein